MSKLLSALVAAGFALGLNAASAQNADPYKQNADPYKQRDTSGAAQEQANQAMKEKMKECRKLNGQAKQDCIKDLEANQGQGTTGAGGTQQEPQSGQAPANDQTKRRQQ